MLADKGVIEFLRIVLHAVERRSGEAAADLADEFSEFEQKALLFPFAVSGRFHRFVGVDSDYYLVDALAVLRDVPILFFPLHVSAHREDGGDDQKQQYHSCGSFRHFFFLSRKGMLILGSFPSLILLMFSLCPKTTRKAMTAAIGIRIPADAPLSKKTA